MDNFSEVQTTDTTSDFVVDLLSGVQIESTTNSDRAAVPPKPAPRRRKKRPKEGRGQQVAENHGSTNGDGSSVKQTLPPEDDTLLVNAPVAGLAESIGNDESESRYAPDSGVLFTVGDGNDYQSCEYSRDTSTNLYVMSPAAEEFNCTHLLSLSSSVSGGEELLLASVPYQTLRIEPSPALTLNSPKHQSSRATGNADVSRSGRFKSSGSLSDDLDNLQEMASFGRSSSTPMLIGDVESSAFGSQQDASAVTDNVLVQKLNVFFGEKKETATALETSVYESLLNGPLSSAYDDMLTAAQKAKKSLSAWSLATKLTASHLSLSSKQKKSPTEDTHEPSFQRTKERRSLRGRVAALVRHGAVGTSANTEVPPQTPKTFGIPLHTCVMSSLHEHVPLIVEVCIGHIEAHGLDSQGIYRIPGNAGVVQQLQQHLDREPRLKLDSELWNDVNVVASLLKLFVRKLPRCLLTPEQYSEFVEANRCENSDDRYLRLRDLLDALPGCNYNTLRFLMQHLNCVALHQDENKMDAYNLAIMFGPALVRPLDDDMTTMLKDMNDQSQIVESLVRHYKWFFCTESEEEIPEDDYNSDSTSPQLLPNVEHLVEIQGLRDHQPHEMLVTVDSSLAPEAGKSRRKTRRRKKRRNNNPEDALSSSATREENSVTRSEDVQPLTAGSGEACKAESPEELFEVKRYPAYHYDMYGTIYSLTDGVRPTTLEKNTMKSASAECLDVHSIIAQPSERRSSNNEVGDLAAPVTAEQRKPKPPAKPLKPLPRPKPRPDISGKDTALKSASTDPAFVAELSSLLKQRNQ